MKPNICVILLVLTLVTGSCQAESAWDRLKDKFPSRSDFRALVDQAGNVAAKCVDKIVEVLTSPEAQDVAEQATKIVSKAVDTAQEAAGIAKEVAMEAGLKGTEAVSCAAEKLGQFGKDAWTQAAEAASEKGKMAASFACELGKDAGDKLQAAFLIAKETGGMAAEKASKKARDAIDTIKEYTDGIFGDLKNFAFDFANCSAEKTTTCKRCQKIKIGVLGIDDEVCIALTYLPEKYALSTAVTLGQASIFNETYSLTNPPPICYIPPKLAGFVSPCLTLTDIKVKAKKLNACLRLDTSVLFAVKTYSKNIGCFSLGPWAL